MYGRCIPEILRTLEALQNADEYSVSTPANWVNDQPVIQSSPQTFEELKKRAEEIKQNNNGMSWYLSFTQTNRKENETSKKETK